MHSGAVIGREAPPPDARQTRIDFIQSPVPPLKKNKQQLSSRPAGFDLFRIFSSWFRPADREKSENDLEGFRSYLLNEGYSRKSCSSYIYMLRKFFEHFSDRAPASLNMGDIEDYNYEYFVSGRYARSYQLQFISAVRLYYRYNSGLELNLKHLRKTDTALKKRK